LIGKQTGELFQHPKEKRRKRNTKEQKADKKRGAKDTKRCRLQHFSYKTRQLVDIGKEGKNGAGACILKCTITSTDDGRSKYYARISSGGRVSARDERLVCVGCEKEFVSPFLGAVSFLQVVSCLSSSVFVP
jgi:hypothetical protein